MTSMSVIQYLKTLPKNETIHYRANPGNAGDALIACGAFKLFHDTNLRIEIIDIDNFDATDKIVIYAGGGNLVGIYPDAREFFIKHHKQAKLLVLLPHTVHKNEDLLKELGENVVLFAREQVSYEHLKHHAVNATVYIDHDLAFSIDVNEMLAKALPDVVRTIFLKIFYRITNKKDKYARLPQPQIMLRNYFFELTTFVKDGYKVGNFFRTDVERVLEKLPKRNADLSKQYEYGTRNESITLYTTARLLKFLNKFDSVKTDRLHICIGAALLGKRIEFYPNSYFKCRAVYEYSLKDRYPNIIWVEPRSGPGNLNKPISGGSATVESPPGR